MIKKIDKNVSRLKRHKRVRNNIKSKTNKLRLNVFRSNTNIYAQIIDDVKAVTLVSASSLEKEINCSNGGNKEAAFKVGELLAKKAIDKGIQEVVFDRGGYVYHGRVKELAEGARKGGLKF